jgi:hypothetical protein
MEGAEIAFDWNGQLYPYTNVPQGWLPGPAASSPKTST